MSKPENFESALNRLEKIVGKLESGEIQLEEMLKIYEEGAGLINYCLEKLDSAEKKIKKLSGDNNKNYKLELFDE